MIENKERYIIDFHDFPKKRLGMPELEVDKRIDNFDEVELGLREAEAQEEAKRCLSCRRCLGCALCLAACEPKAIVFEQEDEILELMVDDIIISPEAGTYMLPENKTFGFGKYKNVICAFELERMLDQDGPSNGLLLRPFDGEIPEKIAIILDLNGNKDPEKEAELVSYALQEAALALDKVDGLAISLFVSEDTVVTGKEGITVIKSKIAELKEVEETKNLIVAYNENDNTAKQECDMLVIATQPDTLPEIKEIQKKLATLSR